MKTQSEFSWQSEDQLKFYGRVWDIEKPKAVICLVHGMGEHCSRYDHMANYYNDRGFSLITYDQRGHGKTEGRRGHTPAYKNYLDDASAFVKQAEERYPNVPMVLYGHSMGGNVVLNYILTQDSNFSALVTTGPWIKLAFEPPAVMLAIGKLLRNIVPGFTQGNGLKVEHLSHDNQIVKAYIDDPLVHDKVTSAAGIDIMKAGDWLTQYTGEMPIPALIMHGADDQITSAKASKAFAEKINNVAYKEWPGLYHEIHNELNKEEVYQYAIDWINKELF